ncbi:cytochrome P450 2F2-like [Boleophthalmus pectinirostris]|uniref:cytochrome P450 2F2-like n=1 Tax=Boleophthalmus pectinirostris TaxID=150288 RepID=UPI00242B18F0|nr:cytochrome P450 2F2-like [Boleophthalmus pectinirostris]
MVAYLLLLGIFMVFIIIHLKSRRPKGFPPGPIALPFLGSIHKMCSSNPLNDIEKLRKTYGNIYSLYLGRNAAVVLCGTQALKEALVNKAVDFAGRHQDLFMTAVTKRRGGLLADYGPTWKEHRRFTLMTLRNFGLGKQSMEQRILGELQYTIDYLEKNTGKIFSPQIMFHSVASNVICQLLFNNRYEHGEEFITTIVNSLCEIIKMNNGPWALIHESFPWVRCLPLPFTNAFEAIEVLKKLIIPVIEEHKKDRVPGEPRDFVDSYLDELEKVYNDGSSFSSEELLMYCLLLYMAGTDTTANTLLFGFLYLMNRPHIQERCQEEIDRVLEGKDFVTFEDRHDMPYVQAVIHEAQRTADTVPLSLFHATTRDTELMGYSIPKGTIVIPNLSSALWEEGQWKFPHEFNPENFLNDKGEFVKPDAFLPFSAGLRVCLGEALARMELFLMMVTLLKKFKFIWPEDAGEPDFTPVYGLTMTPKPYNMRVEIR